MNGIVRALFISPRKKVLVPVHSVEAVATGFSGDYHSEFSNERQILLLSMAVLRHFDLQPGALFENLVVDDMDVMSLRSGQQLRMGEGLFEVTIPCDPCSQMNKHSAWPQNSPGRPARHVCQSDLSGDRSGWG